MYERPGKEYAEKMASFLTLATKKHSLSLPFWFHSQDLFNLCNRTLSFLAAYDIRGKITLEVRRKLGRGKYSKATIDAAHLDRESSSI
jgi:hypothetical protein